MWLTPAVWSPAFNFSLPSIPFSAKLCKFFVPSCFLHAHLLTITAEFQKCCMSAAASDFSSAALKSQSLCGQNKEASKFRNWDNGCPVKIKTSIAFYWPGLRNFCLSLCILTRICSHVQLSFQTRSLLCFVLVDAAWLPIAKKDALEIWPTRQAWTVCSEIKYFDFPVATFSVFKLSVLLLKHEAFSESFSFIFDHLTSW